MRSHHLADGHVRTGASQLKQLTLDPTISPPRVFASQSEDQVDDLWVPSPAALGVGACRRRPTCGAPARDASAGSFLGRAERPTSASWGATRWSSPPYPIARTLSRSAHLPFAAPAADVAGQELQLGARPASRLRTLS